MPQTRPSDADYQVMRDGSDHGELSAAEIRNRFSQQYHGEPRWVLSPSGGEHLYHQGGIGKARRSKLSTVAGYIIVTEFCERLAYFGLSGRVPALASNAPCISGIYVRLECIIDIMTCDLLHAHLCGDRESSVSPTTALKSRKSAGAKSG